MGFSAMLVEEYKLIDPFVYHLSAVGADESQNISTAE
jgi:hypothetical protein